MTRFRAASAATTLALAALLAGCAAKGPLYGEHLATQAPLAEGQARLLVYRPDTGNYGRGAQVMVYLNEFQRLGAVEYQGFNSFRVPAGTQKLTVNGGGLGSCRISLPIQAGEDNAVELRPEGSAIATGAILGGVVGAQIGSLFGSGDCAGGWVIVPVSMSTAQERVRTLRLSTAALPEIPGDSTNRR